MNLPNGFEHRSVDDQDRFLPIQDFVDELNIRLFEVEEMLLTPQPQSGEFTLFNARYESIVELVQELQDDLAHIGQVYGLNFHVR